MSNVEKLITKHIDTWASAIKSKSSAGRGSRKKQELYGIKKLRELIFELAVRGFLTSQDKNDESALIILDKIVAEKEELIKNKVIKRQKKLSPISKNEVPFDLPESWQWARLGNTGIGSTGNTPSTNKPENFDGDIPFIGPGQITPTGNLLEPDKYLSEQGIKSSTEALPGDVLMVCIGGSIGKSVISNKRVAFNQQINAIRPLHISSKYLNICVSAKFFYSSVLEKSTGSATPIINRGKWEELIVPICSLNQQEKVEKKVNELMTICDQLEQQTDTNIDAHKTLVSTLLKALTDSVASNEKGAEKFQQAWERISDNFDLLFITESSIDQLKQTILQLSVMGKLVPQDPEDEPASVLLEKIATEKEQLIKDKKMKKQKALPEIEEDEKPFPLPVGWEWARLGNTGIGATGKTPSTKKPEYFDGNIPFIGPGQITPSGEMLEPDKYVSEMGIENSTEGLPGDILMVCIGGSIGKSTIAKKRISFNQQINAIRPLNISPDFLNIALSTKYFYESVLDKATGSATPIINRGKWEELLVPVSATGEQKRIAAQAEKLLSICDALKKRINSAQSTQVGIADAITYQPLN
jgi:type I restriction enzyme S subunit